VEFPPTSVPRHVCRRPMTPVCCARSIRVRDGADDVAPDEGIQILGAGVTRQFVHLGHGRHRCGERGATASWAQQPEAARLGVAAAASGVLCRCCTAGGGTGSRYRAPASERSHHRHECVGPRHTRFHSARTLFPSELLLTLDFQVRAVDRCHRSGVRRVTAFSPQRLHTIQQKSFPLTPVWHTCYLQDLGPRSDARHLERNWRFRLAGRARITVTGITDGGCLR
jgi:hypothetical protein